MHRQDAKTPRKDGIGMGYDAKRGGITRRVPAFLGALALWR
jgi:hypothetical protein